MYIYKIIGFLHLCFLLKIRSSLDRDRELSHILDTDWRQPKVPETLNSSDDFNIYSTRIYVPFYVSEK